MTSGSNQHFLPEITIHNNFSYGDMGKVLTLHGQVYHQEYGFNHEFEAYVAEGLAEFANTCKPEKSCLWIAEKECVTIGSIAILERENNQAQLRWFLVHPDYRGIKLGQHLFKEAIQFCQKCDYHRIFLWTLDNLDAARAIYERNSFLLVENKEHYLWGRQLVEEYYVLNLKKSSIRQGQNHID